MIRTLAIIAAVSFVLALGCLTGAFAIAGGPFFIDDHWRFHHDMGPDDAPTVPAGSPHARPLSS